MKTKITAAAERLNVWSGQYVMH